MADLDKILVINRLKQLDVIDGNGDFTNSWSNFLIEFFRSGKHVSMISEMNNNPLNTDDGTKRMLELFAVSKLRPEDDTEELARFMDKIRDSSNNDTMKALVKKAFKQGKDKEHVEEMLRGASNKLYDRPARQL